MYEALFLDINYLLNSSFQCKNKTPAPSGAKTKLRLIWGKVTRTHGNSGCLRAKFKSNLPSTAMGRRVRIVSI